MIKRRIPKSRTAVLMVLLAITVLSTGMLGCEAKVPKVTPAQDREAFITNRVVEVRIVMDEEKWTSLRANALDKEYVQADFWFDGELVPDVGVRPKGTSSLQSPFEWGSPRFSLTVDFNLLNSARTFRGLKKLNFNNGFLDPTLIRERLASELFLKMGVPAPRESHVDLWVNDFHLGVYTQVEQIDKAFLRQHFANDNGNLYKGAGSLNWGKEELESNRARLSERLATALNSKEVRVGGGRLESILQALQHPEPKIKGTKNLAFQPPDWSLEDPLLGLQTHKKRPEHSALFRLVDVICNEPDKTFPEAIEKVLDVDEVLRFLAVSSLVGYLDSYLNHSPNTHLYEVDGKFSLIAWDMNETFGIYGCKSNVNGNWVNCTSNEGMINYYIDEPNCSPMAEFPLIKRILSYQPYLDTYHRYYEAMLNGPFSVEAMESRINELHTLIQAAVGNEQYKLFLAGDFERNFTEDVLWAMGLKPFVFKRNESVRQQLEGKRPGAGNGSGNMDLCR
jgi:spore coat protein CotH